MSKLSAKLRKAKWSCRVGWLFSVGSSIRTMPLTASNHQIVADTEGRCAIENHCFMWIICKVICKNTLHNAVGEHLLYKYVLFWGKQVYIWWISFIFLSIFRVIASACWYNFRLTHCDADDGVACRWAETDGRLGDVIVMEQWHHVRQRREGDVSHAVRLLDVNDHFGYLSQKNKQRWVITREGKVLELLEKGHELLSV